MWSPEPDERVHKDWAWRAPGYYLVGHKNGNHVIAVHVPPQSASDWRSGEYVSRPLILDDAEFLLSLSFDEVMECVDSWWGPVGEEL